MVGDTAGRDGEGDAEHCPADGTANRSDADDTDGSVVVDAAQGLFRGCGRSRRLLCRRKPGSNGRWTPIVLSTKMMWSRARQMKGRRTAAPRIAPTMRGKCRMEPPIAP